MTADRDMHCSRSPLPGLQTRPVRMYYAPVMSEAELLTGRATPEGTRRFAARFPDLPGHFRCPDRLLFSSLGMGTRPGDPGGADDLAYRSNCPRALEHGVNVFDTSISYRMQHSERNLGTALRRAIREGVAARDEFIVVSKGGYLTVDTDFARTRREAERYLIESYVDTGLVDPGKLVNGSHSLEPAFLRDQIRRSRGNLGLETIDIYCIEDPELHLLAKGPTEFRHSLCAAIEVLEEAVGQRAIAAYGFATWSGLFVPYTEKGHLSISELFEAVLEVGGADNHFRALTFPYSVAMGEAVGLPSQFGAGARPAGALELLEGTGVAVLTSTPLVRGRAARGLPESLCKALAPARPGAQTALQFARSTPGVTTTLVGMRSSAHLEENLELALRPPADAASIESLFAQARVER